MKKLYTARGLEFRRLRLSQNNITRSVGLKIRKEDWNSYEFKQEWKINERLLTENT